MSSRTREKASDDSSSRSERLPFAPSRGERSGESEATPTAAAATEASSTIGSDAMTRPRRLHPYRRSPRFVCHFDGLAAVEVQSIMQMLDRHSLLRLARCSRRMHSDADCDVAWQSQPPLEVVLDRGIGALIAGRFHHSLIVHTPIRIRPGLAYWGVRILLEEDIDAMLTLPRIAEFVHDQHFIPIGEWHRILHHPAMAGLTKLMIGMHAPRDIIDNLVHLPRLHTLDFWAYVFLEEEPCALDASSLPSLPSLTSLGVHGIASFESPVIPAIAACLHLTELRLDGAELRRDDFHRLFTSPNMSRLQRLELTNFRQQLSAEEYSDAFAAMTDLRHLKTRDQSAIDPLLLGLSRAPHLTTLEVAFSPRALRYPPPSVAVLQTMIAQTEATSRVHVTLQLGWYIDPTAFAALDPSRLTLLPVE